MVYAYYEVGGREEPLERHVNVGLTFIDELYISRGYHYHMARRLNIDEETSKRILKATYTLHDLGKAYRPFQDMILIGRGAPGHEVVSAYIALKCLNGISLDFRRAIAFSILLHHHAMRTILKAILKIKSYKSAFTLPSEGLEELSKLCSNLGFNIALENRIEPETIIDALEELGDLFKASSEVWREYTLAYLLLHPLITCDVLAATVAALKFKPEYLRELNTILDKIPPWVKDYVVIFHH